MFDPDYNSAIGLLQHLNKEELQQLLDNDDKLVGVINDLQQVKNLAQEKEMLVASNKSLAEYNLSLKPVLEQHRGELISRYEQASSLKTTVMDMRSSLVRRNNSNQSDVVLALLQTATAEAEEATENLMENLLDNRSSVDEFLDAYLKKRAHVHVLRTKCDKMSALLQRTEQVTTQPDKPRRLKKAPPPPTAQNTNLPYPAFMNFPSPMFPSVPQHSNGPIVPARIAPMPPVQIPRRVSNPPQPEIRVSPNPPARPHLRNNMPYGPAPGAYPQFVKLPN